MGKIAELRKKIADGNATDEEKAELKELLNEAKAEDNEGAEDEEKMIDDLAAKLSEKAVASIEEATKKAEKVFAEAKDHNKPADKSALIYDRKLGEVPVGKLEEVKVKVPGRKDKETQEVSAKTVHFLNALATGDKQKLQTLVEGTDSRGGYLVPEDFANMIVEDSRDIAVMRQVADVMTITTDKLNLPSLASRPQSNWRSEAATKHTSTVDFSEIEFTPYSLATIVGLSDELVADASLGVNGSIVNYVSGLMARSLVEKEEAAFVNGDGSGKPTGINQASLTEVTAASGSATNNADAVIKGYQRLHQAYRNRAVWIANSQTWESVATLKDANNNYLLSSLANGPTQTLRGRPIFEQNDLPNNVLIIGDFATGYKIVDREGIATRVSDEAVVASVSAFESNLTFVRVEKRTDGKAVLTQAFHKVNLA